MNTMSGIGSGNPAWPQMEERRATLQGGRAGRSDFSHRLFDKVDADGSGSADAAELQTMLDKLSARATARGSTAVTQALAGTDGKQLLSRFDRNGDGSLSADEFAAGMKGLMPAPGSTVEFAQQRGTRPPPGADAGGAGVTGAGGSRRSSASVDPLDTDEDGKVSQSERDAGAARAVLADLLKAVDKNSDGQLSSDEAATFGKNIAAALSEVGSAASAADATKAAGDGGQPLAARSVERDLAEFARLVLQQYQQTASATTASPQSAGVSVTA